MILTVEFVDGNTVVVPIAEEAAMLIAERYAKLGVWKDNAFYPPQSVRRVILGKLDRGGDQKTGSVQTKGKTHGNSDVRPSSTGKRKSSGPVLLDRAKQADKALSKLRK